MNDVFGCLRVSGSIITLLDLCSDVMRKAQVAEIPHDNRTIIVIPWD